jgi:ABC-2 type transport system ATP-binding protein
VIDGGRLVEVATPATLGGRDTAATVVSWEGPAGRESISTDTPTAEVAKLAARFGGEVPGLTVARPTLEDIYLAMISKEQS